MLSAKTCLKSLSYKTLITFLTIKANQKYFYKIIQSNLKSISL